jgi:hypothetical protein
MDRHFGGLIWTNHALERIKQRGIKQGDVWATFKRPGSSKYDPHKDAWIYQRRYGNEEIEVVAKKNDRGQWLIISAWSGRVSSHTPKEKPSLLGFLKKLFS